MSDAASRLDTAISRIRSILFCLNVITILIGLAVFVLCLWMRFDADFRRWVNVLQIQAVYIGAYILIVASLLKMASGVFGCVSASNEDITLLTASAGVQLFCFILGLAGAAVLMDFTTYDSSIHPIIQRVMNNLISRYPADEAATHALLEVQEEMGCCGADGPNDFLNLRRSLPTQCRDTVTGNAFFYGCSDEITWYLEQKSSWISGVALVLCGVNIINAVLSLILAQLCKKEGKVY